MENSYNARCPAVKRLLKEAQELHEATEEYYAHPLDDNLFEWHFTVRGPPETDFDGGIYHGRIIMPAEYPMKPPNIIFFTPNGRFETNKKICLSISGHHPETWQPSWSIRTALLAIIGFMPTPANGTIGSLDYTTEERAILAKRSVDSECPNCGRVGDLLKERTGANEEIQREAREVSAQMAVTGKDLSQQEKEELREDVKDLTASSPQTKPPQRVQNLQSSASDLPTETTLNPQRQEEVMVSAPESYPTSVTATSVENISSSTPTNSTNRVSLTSSPMIPTTLTTTPSTQNSSSLIANNIILSAAVVLLIALVLRRMLFLVLDSKEEMEDIIL